MLSKLLKVYAVLVTVLALVLGTLLVSPTAIPIPIHDVGHRVFAVKDKHASDVVEGILATEGHRRAIKFHIFPTHQTLLNDGFTVINYNDHDPAWDAFPVNAFSLPVWDPQASATRAIYYLKQAGYEAEMKEMLMMPGKAPGYVVKSSAFDNWALVYRLNVIYLGMPPEEP